jgi:hypothetical protein
MRNFMLLLFAFAAFSCTTQLEQVSPCAVLQDTVRYYNHVYPVIDRTCAIPTCHVNGSDHGDFKNAEEFKKAATSGKLEFMINTRQMPPAISSGPLILTDCEITTIRAWIKNGASIE